MSDLAYPLPGSLAFEDAPLRLTVDLEALVENWRTMGRLSGSARAGAVVKTDAYGLGVEDCGEALHDAGARDFFVMTAPEGATLRAVAPEARIFVLSGVWPGTEQIFFENDLVPVIASYEQLTHWMAVLADYGPYPCALQVDTGFNRLGLTVEEALELAEDASLPQAFSPVLLMSHLMCGDTPGAPENAEQLARFRVITEAFEGIEASLAATGGIALGADYHFDLTRPGISLYGATGGAPIPAPLRTVATAEARILQVREAKAGEAVSYGASQRLHRDSRLAVAFAGYGDGFSRGFSGGNILQRQDGSPSGRAWFDGHLLPVVGRVTMDTSIFDVTDLPPGAIRAGDYIQLFGPERPIAEVAASAGTIEYDLLTALGLRYERLYLRGESF
ncbi:alanine racemase [Gellertiella hungarica]|uniref:Alanine racemase n=1 Tax=Gellertiella hungarica TaxID=1572859 RepID=A0A7W6J692_9HYPH|nr:alanine racemase [Gellertiella hungarica]MBB4065565.1 alanine racemase [Gellertiella hungarica]